MPTQANFTQATNARLGQPTSSEATIIRMFSGVEIPEASYAGAMIYRTDSQKIQVFDGTAWEDVVGGVAGLLTFVGPSAPVAEHVGDLWFDSDDNHHLYRWDGTSWGDVRDTTTDQAVADVTDTANQAASDASDALTTATAAANSVAGAVDAANTALDAAQLAQATADGAIRTYYSSDPPWADGSTQPPEVLGDLWYDSDTSQAYRWSGTAWVLIEDNQIAVALAAAQNAQDTADGKITTFFSTSAPAPEGSGDLWFDTDDHNKLYRWDGSFWQPVALGPQALVATDGQVPPQVTTVQVLGGVRLLTIIWTKVDNATPVTYEVHLSVTSGFTPGPTTKLTETPATFFSAKAMPDGSDLVYGTSYYIKIISKDADGSAAASPEVSGTPMQVTSPDIAAEYVYAGTISAAQIIGGTLQANLGLLGQLGVAGRITIRPPDPDSGDPGGITMSLDNGGYVYLPLDGAGATVDMPLTATSLTSQGNMEIQGTGNSLQGDMTLDAGPVAPSTAPSMSASMDGNILYTMGYIAAPSCLASDGAGSMFVVGAYDSGDQPDMPFRVESDSSLTPMRAYGVFGPSNTYNSSVWGMVLSGGNWYVLCQYYSDYQTWSWVVQVYDYASWTFQTKYTIATSNDYSASPAIGIYSADPSKLIICGPNSSGTWEVRSFNKGNGASKTLLTTLAGLTGGYTNYVQWGTFDTGNSRIIVNTGGGGQSFTTTGAKLTAEKFISDSNSVYGMTFDGSNFYYLTHDSAAYHIKALAHFPTSTTVSAQWTRFNTATGQETKPSPARTITIPARAFAQVAGQPQYGTGNDPNAIRIYANIPSGPTNHIQGTYSGGQYIVYLNFVNLSGPAPPTTEGFSGTSIGKLQSDTKGTDGFTPRWYVDGGGNYYFEGMNNDTGWIPYGGAISSGYGIRYRIYGKTIQIAVDGSISITTSANTFSSTTLTTLPSTLWPDEGINVNGTAYLSGWAGVLRINASGTLSVVLRNPTASAITTTSIGANVEYTLH